MTTSADTPVDAFEYITILENDPLFCRKWKIFCGLLGFQNGRIYDLERMDNSSCPMSDIVLNILKHWIEIASTEATSQNLAKKLRKIGCNTSADKIEKICGRSKFCSGNDPDDPESLIWFNIRQPTINYSGREDELQKLAEQWKSCYEMKRMLFAAITGLGGIGKSELARNFAKTFHEKIKGHCIWINAETNQSLAQSFQELAESEMNIPLKDYSGIEKSLEVLLKEIYTKLRGSKWLLIFDNIESYDDSILVSLSDFAAKQKPSTLKPLVITTSRFRPAKRHFGNHCIQLELNTLTNESAVTFFVNSFNLTEISTNNDILALINKLCERLQCYPLAMQQAAAYISEKMWQSTIEMKINIEHYLDAIDKESKVLFDHKLPLHESLGNVSNTTYLTWRVIFDKIRKTHGIGDEALELMNVICFMAPDNISVELLMKLFKAIDYTKHSSKVTVSLTLLNDHSMITIQQNVLSVHRLVQEITRIDLGNSKQLINRLDTSINFMEQLLREEEIHHDQLIHCQMIWQHATQHTKVVKNHGEFPVLICKNIYNSGRYREAIDFNSEVINMYQNDFGNNSRWTLQLKSWRGSLLKKMGKCNDALLLLKEVYEFQLLENWNADSCLTARSIGDVQRLLDNLDEALQWHTKALEKTINWNGENHSEILLIKNNLALVLQEQGKLSEADKLYNESLEESIRVLGEEHRYTINMRHNLAYLNFDKGGYDKALLLMNKVSEVSEKVWGVDNPNSLVTKSIIARCYERLGRNEEALKRRIEILEGRERLLGVAHPQTLAAKKEIATSYVYLGRGEEALQLCSEILGKEERNLGEEHPDTLLTKHQIALCYQGLGKLEEAFELYTAVLRVKDRVVGSQHPSTLITKNNLAEVLLKQEEYDGALKIFKEVLEVREKVLEFNHPFTLATKCCIAECYNKLGRHDEALALAIEAHELRVKVLGPQHPDTIYSHEVVNRLKIFNRDRDGNIPLHSGVLARRNFSQWRWALAIHHRYYM